MAKIDIELANGQKAGETLKQLTYQAAALKKEVSGLKPGTEDFVKASASLNQVEGRMGDIRKEIKGTTEASNSLKSAFGGILNQIPGFSQISGVMSAAKGGVGGLTGGFHMLKGAIAATGLGLLVLAIAALVQWMSKVEAITNVVTGLWNGLTAAVQTFINAVVNLDFTGLGDKMATAAKEGYNLVQVFDELEDKARALDLTTAESGKNVDQLLLQSKNVQLSFAERIALLDKASGIEKNAHADKLRYATEFAAAVEREVANANRQGLMNDELADKQVAAKKALIEVERESIVVQEKIDNRRSALEEKELARQASARAEAEKIAKAKLAAELEALKVEQQAKDAIRQLENEKSLLDIQDKQAKELAQLEITTQEKILALTGSETQIHEQMKLLREIQGLEMQAINQKYIDQKAAADKTASDKKAAQDLADANREKQIRQDVANFDAQLGAFRLETTRQTVGGIGDLIAQNVKDEEKAKVIKKTFAIVDIGIRLSQELSANALAAAANPLNAVTFGAAGAAQLVASNTRSIVLAALGVAKVASFRRGGIPEGVLNGPSHEGGGIPLVAEGSEIIMTKGVYNSPALRNMASAINVAGGGRSFAVGGVTNPFDNSRGPMASGTGSSDPFQSMAKLENSFLQYAEKVDNWVNTLRVVNNVQDTRKGLQTLNKIESEASV